MKKQLSWLSLKYYDRILINMIDGSLLELSGDDFILMTLDSVTIVSEANDTIFPACQVAKVACLGCKI